MEYPQAVREAVVREALSGGRTQQEIARAHGVSKSSLQHWVRRARRQGGFSVREGEEKRSSEWSGDDRVVQLLQSRAATLDRRLPGRSQHPQRFHGAGTVFGYLDPVSCTSRLGRGDRIECVVFALGSATGRIRPGHLEHRDTGECQVPGDARSVASGRFDPDSQQLPVRLEPAKHRPVSGPGRGERFGAQHRSVQVHNRRGVQVLVGIHAPDDLNAVGFRGRHVRPLVYDGWRGRLRTQPMSDTTVTGRPEPGSHQVTMSVEVGTSTGCPRVADKSKE